MENKSYEVILIGDTGKPELPDDPVLTLLGNHLPQGPDGAVVFLGDNIYPAGMPPRSHVARKKSEEIITAQLNVIKDFKGRIIFLSGNHDWNKSKPDGYEYVIRQEKFIENYFGGRDVFLPSNGCPGPDEIPVNDQLTIIVLNAQWFLQKGFKPIGKTHGCKVNSEKGFFEEIIRLLDKNKDKRVLVLGHLPVYSYGIHGGKFLFKHHLFPFTLYKSKAYFPLPFVGSLLPLYRKFFGSREDISHKSYTRFRKKIKNIFKGYSNIIYAAGHEHNLQYIRKYGNHYIISGSGSKVKYVKPGRYSVYSIAEKGFFKLLFNQDQSVILECWTVKEGKEQRSYSAEIVPAEVG